MKFLPNMKPRIWTKSLTRLFTFFRTCFFSGYFLLGVFLNSCVITNLFENSWESRGNSARLSDGGMENLACHEFAPSWQLQGQVQKVHLISSSKQPVLVYSSLTRGGTKTIWQPLNKKLEIQEDGVVIGYKGTRYVTDFEITEISKGEKIFSYRAKPKNTEVTNAYVEYWSENSNTLRQARVPIRDNEAVQKIWILPTQNSKVFNVIVRVNAFSGQEFDESPTIYKWFTWNVNGVQPRLAGESRKTQLNLSNVNFLSSPNSSSPILLAVANANAEFNSTTPGFEKDDSAIVISEIFNKKDESITLYKSKNLITQLSAAPLPNNQYILSWISEGDGNQGSAVNWMTINSDLSEKGLEKLKVPLSQNPNPANTQNTIFTHETRYNSMELRITNFPFLRNSKRQLSWITKSEDDSGLAIMTIIPHPKLIEIRGTYNELGSEITRQEFPQSFLPAPEKNDRIVGITETFAGKGKSVLFLAKQLTQSQIEQGSLVRSCQLNLKGTNSPEPTPPKD